MLDSLRSAIDSWYSKVLLGILVLSFAILWGAPQLTHTQSNDVLEFDGTTMSLNNALMSEGDTLFRASIMQGGLSRGMMSREQFLAQQPSIYGQQPLHYFFPIGMRLLNEIVLTQTAREYKIGASNDAIRYEINNDPFFKGQNNAFDPEYFRAFETILQRQYGQYITSENILEYFMYYAKRDQILSAMSGEAKMPKVFYDAYNQYLNETRSINYITITPALIGDLTISDDDLAKWFENNKNRYLSPEYREVSFLTLTPEKSGSAEELKKIHDEIDTLWFNGSDLAEIAQNYNMNVQTVTFDANGKTQDGKNIEGLPLNQLISAAFAADVGFHETPLSLPQNNGQNGGYVWYQVDNVIEPRNQTLAEVHDKALNDWKVEETQKRLSEKAKTIQEDIVLKGKTFKQIADENGLMPNMQTGLQRGKQLSNFSPEAMAAFFSGPKGLISVTNGLNPMDFVVFEVSDVENPTGAQLPELAQNVKDIINIALQYDINNAFIQGRMEHKGGIKIINQQLFQQLVQGGNNG